MQLKKKLAEKEEENQKLQKRLEDANKRIGQLASTNELLKLTLTDIRVKIQGTRQGLAGLDQSLGNFDTNIATLQKKLPDMSKFVRKTESQIVKELKDEKGSGTLIDITKKDDDDDD